MSTNDAGARRPRATLRAVVATPILGFAMFASLATNDALPSADAKPPAVPTDSQGYVNSPARCDGSQRAVVIGRTPLSLVAICQDKGGAYEYRGVRLRDGAMQRLPATPLANGCFGAHAEQIAYTVSERKLLLTAGLRVIRDETMREFKDYRTPVVAPVVKTSG